MSAKLDKLTNNAKKLLVAAGVTTATFTGAHLDKKVSHTMNAGNCSGSERWMVKTLQDDGASRIDFDSKERTGVANLIQLQKEDQQGWNTKNDNPRMPDEERVFTVKCQIYFVDEEDDGDIHLAIRDPKFPDSTMVAEIVDPTCTNMRKKAFVSILRKVKGDWRTMYNDKRIWGTGIFEIKGVVFFDKNKHGTGGNSNGVELHPILSIKKL